MDIVQVAVNGHNITPIVMGSSLPFYRSKKFFIGQKEFSYDGQVKTLTKPDIKSVAENAFMYLNAPYLWGGRSPFGIDCSGFTQIIYKLSGILLSRDAWQQAQHGRSISSIEEAREGDLAFFKNDEDKIVHTGIVLNNNRIIHASGKVRVDKLDNHGIFNVDRNGYTHRLASVRRF
jgi:cell wall-associated NlpC family hydrolase